jgi:hypothetical protein
MADPLTLETTVEDLKLVYRVLHGVLAENLELMDAELFDRMQRVLQQRAAAEGVDVGDHAAWDAWLGNVDAVPCSERMKGRRTLS